MSKLYVFPLLLVSIFISLTGCGGDSGDVQVAPATNTAPVADAGVDRNIMTGLVFTLDGSGSTDADADPLTYLWALDSIPFASQATLVSETTVNPSFTPDVDGDYTVSLVVNDGTDDSGADTVTLTASLTANNPPVADAGVDRNIMTGLVATLDGSGSTDADADPLTYLWALDSIPSASQATLVSETTVNPSFTPDVDGDYTVSLVVNDGTDDSSADTVTLTASLTANNPPVADAGADTNVVTTMPVSLDGSASSDLDGDSLTYLWSLDSKPSGSSSTLFSVTLVNPSFTPDVDGAYTVSLVVNDGTVDSAADAVTITASTVAVNNAPVADAGVDQNVDTSDVVTLDGSGSSDLDGDSLTYLWSLDSKPSGSSSILFSVTLVNPSFTPDVDGAYTVSLVVNDGTVDSAADTVVVTATTTAPVGSFADGRDKYDADCAVCHAAGSHDISTANGGNDLYQLGDLVIADISSYSPNKGAVADLTAQEILDLKAFLNDPSIAP